MNYKNLSRNKEKAQWVKCFPWKHEEPSLDPQYSHKNQAWWQLSVIPKRGRQRHVDSWSSLLPSLDKLVSSRFSEILPQKVRWRGAGETAHKWGALAALVKDSGIVPRTHTATHNCLQLVLGELMPLSGLCGFCTHGTHTYIYMCRKNMHTHKKSF